MVTLPKPIKEWRMVNLGISVSLGLVEFDPTGQIASVTVEAMEADNFTELRMLLTQALMKPTVEYQIA